VPLITSRAWRGLSGSGSAAVMTLEADLDLDGAVASGGLDELAD